MRIAVSNASSAALLHNSHKHSQYHGHNLQQRFLTGDFRWGNFGMSEGISFKWEI